MTEQVKNRAKFEYVVGAGITAIITTYLVSSVEMPHWAFLCLLLLIVSYFVQWAFTMIQFVIEMREGKPVQPIKNQPPDWLERFVDRYISKIKDATTY